MQQLAALSETRASLRSCPVHCHSVDGSAWVLTPHGATTLQQLVGGLDMDTLDGVAVESQLGGFALVLSRPCAALTGCCVPCACAVH